MKTNVQSHDRDVTVHDLIRQQRDSLIVYLSACSSYCLGIGREETARMIAQRAAEEAGIAHLIERACK